MSAVDAWIASATDEQLRGKIKEYEAAHIYGDTVGNHLRAQLLGKLRIELSARRLLDTHTKETTK